MQQYALVTGADRGLGLALTEGLLTRGYEVFAGALDSHPEGLLALRERFRDSMRIVPLDVRSDASVADAGRAVAALAPALDLVVNNAGILGDFTKSILDDLDFEDMKATYDVNALGPLRVSRALFPLLQKGTLKLIVNISSEAGSFHQSRVQDRRIRYGYCMSKSALNAASVILQNSAADAGIRVLLIEPGWIRSFMHGAKNLKAALEPEESAGAILATILDAPLPASQWITHEGLAYEW